MQKSKKIILIISVVSAAAILTFFIAFAHLKKQTNTSYYSTYLDKTVPADPKLIDNQSPYTLVLKNPSIFAPIQINTDGNNQKKYDTALENGVAHLLGSALPGNPGNSVIFGHSSYYQNAPGNYKEIFKDLNQVEIGETLEINSNSNKYKYKVIDKKIIPADQIDIVSQNYSEHKLTLLTCWPVGTNQKRLAIVANLIK